MLKIYQLRMKQNTFDVTLKYKGVNVRVAFIDGNTYNGTPAKCYTNDLFKQRAIEGSQLFKDKDIVLERSVEESCDRDKAAKKAASMRTRQETRLSQTGGGRGDSEAEASGTVVDGGGANYTGERKTFSNLGEAIVYIAQTFNVQVTSAAEARKVLKEHGVTATIKQG